MAWGAGGPSYYHGAHVGSGGGGGGGGQWSGGWYPEDSDTILSKKMSQVLRHTATQLGLEVLRGGYVRVRDLLEVDHGRYFAGYTENDIVRIVRNNDKQRFALGEDERAGLTVRANQGHTGSTGAAVDDESLLTEVSSLEELERRGETCVHGTYWSCWESIKAEGLKPMGRNHVHFAIHVPNTGEVVSGMRASCEIFIFLDVRKALGAGLKLYRSSNSVLLSRGFDGIIPPEFFLRVVQRWQNKQIWPPPSQAPAPKPLGERRVPGLGPAPAAKGKAKQGQGAPKAAAEAPRPSTPKAEVPMDWEDGLESGDEAAPAAPAVAPRTAPQRAPEEAKPAAPAVARRAAPQRAPEEARSLYDPPAEGAGSKATSSRLPERPTQEAGSKATSSRLPERPAPEARGKATSSKLPRRPEQGRSSPLGADAAAPAEAAESAEGRRRWTSNGVRQAETAAATATGAEPRATAQSAVAGSSEQEKEMRKLQKKLREIETIEDKARSSGGAKLQPEEKEKVSRKADIVSKIEALRSRQELPGD